MAILKFDRGDQALNESNKAPQIWIADPFDVPENKWLLAPKGTRPDKKGRISDIMEHIGVWHGAQTIDLGGLYNVATTGVDTMYVSSIGSQAFLTFYAAEGQIVWVRNFQQYQTQGVYSYDEVESFEIARNEQGFPIRVEPPTPDANDPFRFMGSSSRTTPFKVGPFARDVATWIYSNAPLRACWVTFTGRSTGLSAEIG
jgi:hypothetical protein